MASNVTATIHTKYVDIKYAYTKILQTKNDSDTLTTNLGGELHESTQRK